MEAQFFQAEFKAIKLEGSKTKEFNPEITQGTVIKGYASTTTRDRYGDVVLPEAFEASIRKNYKNNPIILFQHNADRPIGKATFMSIDEKGLYIEAVIVDNEIEPKIQAGILKAFSIGFIPTVIEFRDSNGVVLDPNNTNDRARIWDDDVTKVIKALDLIENSIVSTPANPDALFTLEKSLKDMYTKKRACIEGVCGITKHINEINNNQKNMDKKNLLEEEVKEVEETKNDDVVEEGATEEVVEEVIEEAETKEVIVDETSDDDEDGETDVEEVEADEDIAEVEEKAVLAKRLEEMEAKYAELEKKLAVTPVKKGLANIEVATGVKEEKQDTGIDFKQALISNKL